MSQEQTGGHRLRCVVEYRASKDAVEVIIKGVFDEHFDPKREFERVNESMAQTAKPGLVRFDTRQMIAMNSAGARAWLAFIKLVQSKYRVQFSCVSESFVEMAGLVPALLGDNPVMIESFQVPYYCSACENRFMTLGNPSQVKEGRWAAPEDVVCPKCGKKDSEIDVVEEEHFRFLKRLQLLNQPK